MLKRQVSFSFFYYVNFFFLIYILYSKYIVSYSLENIFPDVALLVVAFHTFKNFESNLSIFQ